MNAFDNKSLKPMLIGEEREAFDSEDYIFELKLNGSRCFAYVDYDSVDFRNARNINCNHRFPELSSLYIQVKKKCILDGELIILIGGKPDFHELQRRSLLRDDFKIKLASQKYAASYTVFDILFLEDDFINDLPLMERKKILAQNIYENNRLAISRYIFEYGIEFHNLAKKSDLEGIVAKKKNSKYYFGKKTKDWINIKNG